MRFENRQYQTNCVDEWEESLEQGYNSVIAVPTGAGKTVILCSLVERWLNNHLTDNILVLSHTQEILEQDTDALLEFFPSFGVGVYSAGLNRREKRKITVAGIQSVYKHPELFEDVNLCIIDEVHSINHKDKGMYRTFLKAMGCQITGMSATVFRMGHGYIYKGEGAIFDSLAYDLTSVDNFNKLVEDGYLTNLVSKATEMELDSSQVKKAAGDYNLKHLAKAHDRDSVTSDAVKETIKYGKNFKKWLIFAIDTVHAKHICDTLIKLGINADELHTKMSKDRRTVIDNFKEGDTRALVSVGMVTTGFDAPNVDMIVLLRPTLSTVLHVQMVGRGLRTYPGKKHCLVLDFAGNTMRLGPINNPVIPDKKKKGAPAEAPVKKCPMCLCLVPTVTRRCPMCGHVFVFKTAINAEADMDSNILQTADNNWQKVTGVYYNIHHKVGSPSSLKVTYQMGLSSVSEWVCLNHQGYAKSKADNWVKHRDPGCRVFTTEHVYGRREFLKVPKRVLLQKNGRYKNIKRAKFE